MANVSPHPDEFIAGARREFRFLVTDHGFVEMPINVRRYYNPVSVRFESRTTLIKVEGIAYGSSTNVELGMIPQPSGDLDCTLPLWPIAQLRYPELYEAYRQTKGQLDQLPILARLLNLAADDILRGDFTTFPYIEQSVSEYIAELRAQEAEREFKRKVQRASNAFWQKRYREVVELLEPDAERLSPAQARQLSYARRNL